MQFISCKSSVDPKNWTSKSLTETGMKMSIMFKSSWRQFPHAEAQQNRNIQEQRRIAHRDSRKVGSSAIGRSGINIVEKLRVKWPNVMIRSSFFASSPAGSCPGDLEHATGGR